MTKISKLAGSVLVFSLSLSFAIADTVSNLSPQWVLLPGSLGPNTGTWGLPAQTSCGTENEPTCEVAGDFVVDHPFTTSGAYFITSSDGTLSDIITFGNTAPGGLGEIVFSSDPSLPTLPTGATSLCTEVVNAGCIGTFSLTTTDGTNFRVSAASDDEAAFDPFGFGVDTSDDIQFNGITVNPTPEPSSLLMSLALLGVGVLTERIARKHRAERS
jgi:hypothetical protein